MGRNLVSRYLVPLLMLLTFMAAMPRAQAATPTTYYYINTSDAAGTVAGTAAEACSKWGAMYAAGNQPGATAQYAGNTCTVYASNGGSITAQGVSSGSCSGAPSYA